MPEHALPVWIELHVDDEVLEQAPERFLEARALLDTIARVAEDQGARLSFRFRRFFAEAARDTGFLPLLAERGHGIGVHAHGSDLARATTAVRACGIDATVAVPGLVQAGPNGRSSLLRQCARLGLTLVTDHGPELAWAYEGLAPRQEHGVLTMAPTVRPFDWGLMDRDGRRHGFGEGSVEPLRRLETLAATQGARWFGLALHEHDLCPPGSLHPTPDALAGLATLLDARVQPAAAVARRLALDTPPPSAPTITRTRAHLGDARIRLARTVRTATTRLPRRPRRGVRIPAGGRDRRLRVDHRTLALRVWSSPSPQGLVLMSHAGREGGRALALRPFGLSPRALLDAGFALWAYDRAGTGGSAPGLHEGLAPGNPDHVADWRAALEAARAEGLPVLALSWSAGVLPVLRAAALGDRPDALVDAEGPADRWSLVPPGGNELSTLDPWSSAPWQEREPRLLLPELGVPYHRLQGVPDHVHGDCTEHAARMAAAAGTPLRILDGPIHGHGPHLVDILRQMLAQT